MISVAKLQASWIALQPLQRAKRVAFAKPRVVDYVKPELSNTRVEIAKSKPVRPEEAQLRTLFRGCAMLNAFGLRSLKNLPTCLSNYAQQGLPFG